MVYDAIVIGSGVAGMSAALLLRKEGMQVLLLEQYSGLGGHLRVFRRRNCLFPIGVHCLGSLQVGQVLWRFFKYMGILERVRLAPMNPDGFEEYVFPDFSFRVPCGKDSFKQRLLEQFPQERSAIERFLGDMVRVIGHFSLYHLRSEPDEPTQEAIRPLREYLDELGCSEALRAVLTAVNPFYGIEPSQCPLYAHFLVFHSMLSSAWRIVETDTPLAEAFTQSLGAEGVVSRTGATVTAITSSEGRASGVRLADGEEVASENVIFTGHPRQLNTLCAQDLRPAYRQRLLDLPETPGLFGLGLAWRGDDCPFSRCDTLIYSDFDTERHYHARDVLAGKSIPDMIYCSASAEPRDGIYPVIALCVLPPNELRQWESTRTGSRPDSYTKAKTGLAQRILETLFVRYPDARGRVTVENSFTSLTTRDCTLSPEGSAYGTKKQAGFSGGSLSAATHLKGLYLAGQSIVLPGVVGTIISAINACSFIVGRKHLVDKIRRQTS